MARFPSDSRCSESLLGTSESHFQSPLVLLDPVLNSATGRIGDPTKEEVNWQWLCKTEGASFPPPDWLKLPVPWEEFALTSGCSVAGGSNER
uniref:Uncharacterized protein n=1 Tax=Knipowitschia caucasica TaxID=637954 RepID=A0AAV2LJ56_KNICA